MLDNKKHKVQDIRTVILFYFNSEIKFVCANAEELPFEENSFDIYTIAFGIRNVPRIPKALSEANRVLKQGGKF